MRLPDYFEFIIRGTKDRVYSMTRLGDTDEWFCAAEFPSLGRGRAWERDAIEHCLKHGSWKIINKEKRDV